MANEEDLFSSDDQNQQQQQQSETGTNTGSGSPSDTDTALAGAAKGDLPPEIAEWVGEGKKFSNVSEFVKAYGKSQEFIDQLQQENKSMRDEIRNSEKLDEILSRVGASGDNAHKGEGPSGGTPPSGAGTDEANKSDSGKSTEQLIHEAVQSEVTRREREQTANQNETQASDQVIQLAGGDRNQAKEMIKKAASDLGVTVDYLREQARVSPSAFYRMVSNSHDDRSGSQRSTATGSSQNSQAFESQAGGFRSPDSEIQPWSYWRKMRREMSKAEYYSPRVQNQIMRSRAELGDKFNDTTS